MEKEHLIKKWLDNDLSPEEAVAFRSLDDYESLTRLSKYTKQFAAPQISEEEALNNVTTAIATQKETTSSWYKPLLKIAAVIAICLGAYYYTTTLDSNFSTAIGEKIHVELPDASAADLNALSQIHFNKNSWEEQRTVTLEGEAFFKVAKGSAFDVKTDVGTITVLGTQFNVKQRANHFEVTCYEGLVQVRYDSIITKLSPGQSFVVINKKISAPSAITVDQPEWLAQTSAFKSIPLRQVLAEFERQYKVKVITNDVNLDQLFTGKFTHDNIEVAIKAITQPIKVTYKNRNNTIILARE